MRRALQRLPVLVLVVLPFLILHRGFSGDPDVVLGARFWDMTTILYPQRLFAMESIRSGDFPLWNPFIFCGVPLHASVISAMLYLPNAISFFLPLSTAFNLLFALHVALAGLLTFALLREVGARPVAALFGGIAFACSARVILHVAGGHSPQVAALAWTPGLFWLAERIARRPAPGAALGLAVVAAWSLLAGYPQYLIYASIAVVAMAAGRLGAALARRDGTAARARLRSLALVALGLGGGAVLAAAQLLPGLDYAGYSFRARGPATFLATGDLSLLNIATLLFPAMMGDAAHAPYFGQWAFWNTCVYVGVGTLAFAALALVSSRESRRRALPWAALAAAAFLISMGNRTPLFGLFVKLPVVGMLRGIAKMTSVGVLGLVVLSGLGMEAFLAARGESRRRGEGESPEASRRLVTILALLLIAGLAGIAATAGDAGLHRAERLYTTSASPNEHDQNDPRAPTPELVDAIRDAIAGDAWRLAIFAGALLAVAVVAGARPGTRRLAGPLFCALLAADLFLTYEPLIPTQSVARDIEMPPELSAHIRETPPLARFGASERRECRGMLYGAAAVGGFEGNLPATSHAFMNFAADRPLDAPPPAFQPVRLSPLLDLLVMQRLILDGPAPIDSVYFRRVAVGPRFAVYDRARHLPRAYLAHHVSVSADRAALWGAIRDGRLDPFATAVVLREQERSPVEALPPGGGPEPVPEVSLVGPDRVVVRAQPSARALLVLLDAYDPGWRAAVDGRPSRIVPVFGFFRGVYLEAGAREVVFSYAPRAFRNGVILSLAGWTAAAALVVAGGLARRRARWRSRSTSQGK